MENTGYYIGCEGCVDFSENTKSCDYLFHNGHCRPCKADSSGCALHSRVSRRAGTEESRRTWSTKAALQLLDEGKKVAEAAKRIGASINSLQVWIQTGMPTAAIIPWTKVNNAKMLSDRR